MPPQYDVASIGRLQDAMIMPGLSIKNLRAAEERLPSTSEGSTTTILTVTVAGTGEVLLFL